MLILVVVANRVFGYRRRRFGGVVVRKILGRVDKGFDGSEKRIE